MCSWLLTDYINETNDTQIDNTKDIDVVMLTHTFIEYSDRYSKISGKLWQSYRDEWTLTDTGAVDNFPENSTSFKFKQKLTGKRVAGGRRDIAIMMPLKYLSIFWRIFAISLINCEINLILTRSDK